MKKVIPVVLLFAVLAYCLPFAGLLVGKKGAAPSVSSSITQIASSSSPVQMTEAPLLILDEGTDKVLTVPVRNFVLGAVAAEMPMTYPDEALKAQAVAAHSYALAVKAKADGSDATLRGAYFKANPAQRLGFVTDEVMRSMWGKDYDTNLARLGTLVDSVLSETLVYNGETALACYHAISCGKTEDAASVWGTPVPYLISVDSQLDLSSPDYLAEMLFTSQELYEALVMDSGLALEGDPSTWITGMDMTPAGYVQTIHFGEKSMSGSDFRRALSLRSAAFTLDYTTDKVFRIVTHGYGHGVGMSQYGASALALAGKTYRDILAQYYPGTQIVSAT